MKIKLTKSELLTLTEAIDNEVDYLNKTTKYFWTRSPQITLDGNDDKSYFIHISNPNKFIKFLNDGIDNCFPVNENGMSQMVSAPNGVFYEGSESQKQDNLFSILSKVKISSE
tara:strand:+ start:5023 stop:5361 length:339 start_codon:yes stop_codon:yes gene_type:complete